MGRPMTMGKILAGAIVISAFVAGAALYYLQVYAYYDEVSADAPQGRIMLTSLASNQPDTFLYKDFQGIDATSSPLRFRACFTTKHSQAMLSETYVTMEGAVPLNGPGWFECYNAQEIGAALETGDAIAFLGQKDILDGIDRVIAVFPDGRGFAWHQLNDKYKE